MSFDLMSGRDKLEREISVFTLAHRTKFGRNNCGIKVSLTSGGGSNLSRDNAHYRNKLSRLPKLGRDNSQNNVCVNGAYIYTWVPRARFTKGSVLRCSYDVSYQI